MSKSIEAWSSVDVDTGQGVPRGKAHRRGEHELRPDGSVGAVVPLRRYVDLSRPTSPVPDGPDEAPRARVGLLQRLLAIDVIAFQVGWWLSTSLSPIEIDIVISVLVGTASTVAGMLMLASAKLYRSRVATVRQTEIRRLGFVALGFALVAQLGISLVADASPSAWHLAVTGCLAFITLTIGRSFFDEWLRAKRSIGCYQRSIVLVGSGVEIEHLLELVNDHPDFGLRVREVVHTADRSDSDLSRRVLTSLKRTSSSGVLLTAQGISIDDKRRLISDLAQHGIHVHLSSGLWGVDYRRVRAVPVAHEPLLYIEPADTRRVHRGAKRAIDLIGAVLLLLVFSPVLLITAIAILIEDGRPILFRQRRVGQGGTVFDMLKFRSMVRDAESIVVDLRGDNDRQGPLYKNERTDPRITKVGRVIRALSIDELPQLWNVLWGSMSLVGPRPALPHEVEEFDEDLRTRTRAKPGITGLWQVEARDKPSFSAYKRLDLFYVDNWSSMLDVVILVMTVQSVIGRGFRMLRGRTTPLEGEPPRSGVEDQGSPRQREDRRRSTRPARSGSDALAAGTSAHGARLASHREL